MQKNSGKPKSEYAIQTVMNALRMLEVFHAESEMGVSELARRLGLHKNNAFRLLATLELAGYMQQTPETDRYHLGPRCLELGQAFLRTHTLINQARPILEELAESMGETAHLGILRGDEVVHLDGVLPEQLVLTSLRVGERLPAYCTALGKVLLRDEAFETPDRVLIRHTDKTLVDPAKLADELRAVALRGYATDVEEFATGLRCVAAPVRDVSSNAIAAISLSGPSLRLSEEVLHGTAARAVAAAAAQLSQKLGSPA